MSPKKKAASKKKGVNDAINPLIRDTASEIAAYYGFKVVPPPAVTEEDTSAAKEFLEVDVAKRYQVEHGKHPLAVRPEEKIALLRELHTPVEQGGYSDYDELGNEIAHVGNPAAAHRTQKGMHKGAGTSHKPLSHLCNIHHGQPAMLFYEEMPHPTFPRKRFGGHRFFHMDVIGTTKSIAEAILIKTTREILREEGYDQVTVAINSVGDRESMARFCRELANYYRKHINELSPFCRQVFKKDPFDLFIHNDDSFHALKNNAPVPVNFLTESARIHFREVLEYLEALNIPFEIENHLVCDRRMWSQTVFEIRDQSGETLLASGARYNAISKKLGYRREVGGVGIAVHYKSKKVSAANKDSASAKACTPADRKKLFGNPLVYFVQLGFDAKLKSLEVIEILRRAGVPMVQALARDKINGQMQSAENSRIPYTLIMGQKEAMEGSVILRDMDNRSQTTIKLPDLGAYIRKLKSKR